MSTTSSTSTSSSVSSVCGGTSRTSTISTVVADGLSSSVATSSPTILCPQLSRTIVLRGAIPLGKYYMFYTDEEITVQEIRVVTENTTPSCFEWNIKYSANYNGIGTDLLGAVANSTSTSTGNSYPTEGAFATGAEVIPAESHIWLDIQDVQQTTFVALTLIYKPQCSIQEADIDNPITTQSADGTTSLLGLNPPFDDLPLFE